MSTSRITRDCRSLMSSGPGAAQHPAWSARVIVKLVGLRSSTLHREALHERLSFAPRPAPGHLAHPDDPSLPSEAQWTHGTVDERRQHVHRIVERFEHELGWAPRTL